jgi:hypothetical protein
VVSITVLHSINSYCLTERKYCGKSFVQQSLFSIHFVGLFVVNREERTARYYNVIFMYRPCDVLCYTYNERSSSEHTRKLPMAVLTYSNKTCLHLP